MLQLKNNTPFAAQLALFPNAHGVDTLYIIVKATFAIAKKWSLADLQSLPQGEDVYYGDDPTLSSIKIASDIHLSKPSTDIIMIGSAKTLNEQNLSKMDVSLTLGTVSKTIHVFGDRFWDNSSISSATPFTTMPLTYERAYGGVHIEEGIMQGGELRNPVGCGYLGKRKANSLNEKPVPNLEDPAKKLIQCGDVVEPAGFGVISPSWQPRVSFAGSYDEKWQQTQAPYLPDDFDSRFFNLAHPDLIYSGYLQGGEPVSISGMHHGGPIQFNLPVISFKADVTIKSRIEHPEFKMETVIIDTDNMQLAMAWKAELACDKETLNIREVVINLSQTKHSRAA